MTDLEIIAQCLQQINPAAKNRLSARGGGQKFYHCNASRP